jgi:phage-related minor tail protein
LGYIDGLKSAANQGNREQIVELFDNLISSLGSNVTTEGYLLADRMRQIALSVADITAEMNGSAKAARVAVHLEEKRVESIQLYYDNLKKVSDLQQERKAGVQAILDAVDAEKKSMTDTLDLNRLILQFGKDSAQVKAKEAAIAREQYRLELINAQIKGNRLIDAMALYDANVGVTDAISKSEGKAKGLAAALKEAASAMSSLSSFGDSLDKALAVSLAKVQALKAGVDASIAGSIAGMRADLSSRVQQGLASGVPIGTIMAEIDSSSSTISQLEASETQRKALEEAKREADRASKKADKDSPLEKLQKELDLQRELVGQSEAYVKVRQALGDDYAKTSTKIISDLQAQYAETQKLIEIEEQRQSIIGKVESSMESALMSIVDGTKSVKDAFRSMAAEIIKELYRIFVVKRITGMIAGTIGDASSMAGGNFFSGIAGKPVAQAMGGAWMNGVQMFANGGVVDSPTMFGHSGGVGVMGEAGPEAIMPLKRGANGKLGVSVEGGSGAVNVTNNINVTGGSDPAAIRMEVAKLMPQITSATKSAVIDARRRGGQMKAAFG